jgi:hypothetical protein
LKEFKYKKGGIGKEKRTLGAKPRVQEKYN